MVSFVILIEEKEVCSTKKLISLVNCDIVQRQNLFPVIENVVTPPVTGC